MASRYFQQFTSSLDRNVVILDGTATLNGSSAPTNLAGKGLSSLVHTSTGVFTLTLSDRYYALLTTQMDYTTVTGLSGLTSLSYGVTSNVNNATPTVTFTFVNGSGVVTDPPSGLGITFVILLKNTFL
jgi:hypothetical protein